SVRRARQRHRAHLPRQLRLPRGRPARDAGYGHPRLDAHQGALQLRLGARNLGRRAPGRALAGTAAPAGRAAPGDGDALMAQAGGAAVASFEPAGELRIGQVGIANLRIRTLDIPRLAAEMRERVQRAPKLFARGAVVIDFGGLPALPDAATARALIDALREAGALPVALA